jgi:hypothetical protein
MPTGPPPDVGPQSIPHDALAALRTRVDTRQREVHARGDPGGDGLAREFVRQLSSDPADAACTNPPVQFGQAIDAADHEEVPVRFTCEGAVLAGTIYAPKEQG